MHGWLVGRLLSLSKHCKVICYIVNSDFNFVCYSHSIYIHMRWWLKCNCDEKWLGVWRVLSECEWSDNDFRTSTLLMHVVGSFPQNRIQLTHINLPHSHQKLHVTNSKFNLSERHYQNSYNSALCVVSNVRGVKPSTPLINFQFYNKF